METIGVAVGVTGGGVTDAVAVGVAVGVDGIAVAVGVAVGVGVGVGVGFGRDVNDAVMPKAQCKAEVIKGASLRKSVFINEPLLKEPLVAVHIIRRTNCPSTVRVCAGDAVAATNQVHLTVSPTEIFAVEA